MNVKESVTPAEAGVQKIHSELKRLDSGFRRNDRKKRFRLFTKPSMASHTKPKGSSSMIDVQCPMFKDQ